MQTSRMASSKDSRSGKVVLRARNPSHGSAVVHKQTTYSARVKVFQGPIQTICFADLQNAAQLFQTGLMPFCFCVHTVCFAGVFLMIIFFFLFFFFNFVCYC